MKLDELPKKNIYEVPAGYFEKLPGVMMTRVQEKTRVQNPVWILLTQNYWLRGALAGLALVIGLFFVFMLNKPDSSNQIAANNQNQTNLISAVSKKEAMDYLLNTEQLQPSDLAYLSQADRDISHEFIQASDEDIWQVVEYADLHDITLN
jgi:hypothetical protein